MEIEEGRKLKAVGLYKNRKVSLGLACRLAGMHLSEFMDLLVELNVPSNLTIEDAKESLNYARRII